MPTLLAQSSPSLSSPWMWAGFVAFMLIAMVVDLGLGRKAKAMSTRTAVIWCCVWVSLAFTFAGGLWYFYGTQYAQEFVAGYLLEYSLSVDNLFVFVLVFAFFRTPPHLQHRALVWGIIGAMVMRACMILAGVALIQRFHFMMAVFGGFLLFSGIKMLFHDEESDPSNSRFVKLLQSKLPISDEYHGTHFTIRDEDGNFKFTRLFLVVAVIEVSDIIFAVDSIPAIFAVTQNAFIVFTSNMFAILGLRSLYFAISGAIQKLRFLNYGLSLVLCFVAIKMLLPFIDEGLKISTLLSLGVICAVIASTVALSLFWQPPPLEEEQQPHRSKESIRLKRQRPRSYALSSSSEDLTPLSDSDLTPVGAGGPQVEEDPVVGEMPEVVAEIPEVIDPPVEERTSS